MEKSYVSVAKRVFNSVEAMFTWIENTEKPTRLTVKPKEKNCNTKHHVLLRQPTLQFKLQLLLQVQLSKNILKGNFAKKIIFYMFFLMYKYGCLYVY